jgi:aminoglycoside 6'-N-acetyltransferase I
MQQAKEIVADTFNFTEEEKEVAYELIEESVSKDNEGYYKSFVYLGNGNVTGFYCIGQRSLTNGVYDLYWIVVKKNYYNKGIGKKLLSHGEEFVTKNNGRLILAETSSKKSYLNTRKFYEKCDYRVLSEIKDFYSVGDNLIVYGKYL